MNFPGTFFEYMQSHPQCGQSLDMTMKGYAEYRGSWLDAYPGENLIREAEPGQVLVVDVGGGLVSATLLLSLSHTNPALGPRHGKVSLPFSTRNERPSHSPGPGKCY